MMSAPGRWSPPTWWKDDPFDNLKEARDHAQPLLTSELYRHLENLLKAERQVRIKKLETVTPESLRATQAEISVLDSLLGLRSFARTKGNSEE